MGDYFDAILASLVGAVFFTIGIYFFGVMLSVAIFFINEVGILGPIEIHTPQFFWYFLSWKIFRNVFGILFIIMCIFSLMAAYAYRDEN
ncbi:hypothetical protein [Bacillus sp. V5-8f]|uniref:hypothetical protein n=1 Tax=Bacillus sp. V5-8f TaxID=2053044 RepID=UPI000C7619EB|nr:hypothetical protein [Bacillus sp. V5-8f]PLT31973.1 hypothetical protein CUU64_20515 [Bacillus sp. V5-8f]